MGLEAEGQEGPLEGGWVARGKGCTEALDETIYINCYYTYTSNLYMYIIATHLITFKFNFLYKLLLV